MTARSSDYLRIVFTFLGAFAQIIMGGIPNILGWEHTIGSRSNEVQTLIVPASYAFVIWSFIFLGCIIFAIVQALPKYRTDASFRKIGWLVGSAFWLNAIWEFYVPQRSLDIISLVIILATLIVLLSALFMLRDLEDTRSYFLPIFLLTGWISVATFVNLSVTTNFHGFNPFALSDQLQAIIILSAAGIVTIAFAMYFRSLFYNFSTTWGFYAIYVINMSRGEYQIAYLALIMGVLGFLIALSSKLIKRPILQFNFKQMD